MRYLFTLLLACGFAVAQSVPRTTPWSRSFLLSTDASAARTAIGVSTNGAGAGPTWDELQTFQAGATVYTTLTATNIAGTVVNLLEIADAPSTPSTGRGVIYADTDGSLYYLDDTGATYNLVFQEAAASLLYQATNSALTALSSNPAMYQATNAALTALSAYTPDTWQATNANLTALASNPQLYQATNANLTALAGNPQLYQATNAALTALAGNPNLYQATNANLTALASNPQLYQATNANLTLLSAYGPTTWQATNSTLTALVADPNRYQATNANLTTLASSTPVLALHANPNLYQATNANLTALASNPQLYQATNANLTALASNPQLYQATNTALTALATNPNLYQATNANLTALASNPQLYQATNATLTSLSTNSITGTGTIILSSEIATMVDSGDLDDLNTSLSDTISALDAEVPKFGETNALSIAFSDLDIEGPVGMKQTQLTGVTPQYNWGTHTHVFHYIDAPTTPSQTGTPKPGQTFTAFHINTNAFAIEITLDGLGWDFQRTPSSVPANSWIALVCTYTDEGYYADVSAPAATSVVTEGGTGRTSHPADYVLMGNVSNPLNAAAVTNGLSVSGSGQAMTLGLEGFQQGLSSLSITTATAGVSVLTNSLVLATNTSVQISGKYLFSGDTNTVGGNMLATYRFGSTLSVTNSNEPLPSGTGLWLYWTTNATFYPVLQLGGIDGEPGYLSVWDIQQRSTSLNVASTPAVTYLLNEDFDDEGAPDSWTTVAGTPDYDHAGIDDESLLLASGAAVLVPDWTDKDGVLIKLRLRINTLPSGSSAWFLRYAPAGSTSYQSLFITTAGKLYFTMGGTAAETVSTMGLATDYYVWVRLYKGTGSNSIMRAAFATTDSEPTSGNQYDDVTNGTYTSQFGRLMIRSDSSDSIEVDNIQITEWTGP